VRSTSHADLFNADGRCQAPTSYSRLRTIRLYANAFTCANSGGSQISLPRCVIRNGTVTHAFGMDQRMVGMSLTAGSGSLAVTRATYRKHRASRLLHAVYFNSNGVPRLARICLLNPELPRAFDYLHLAYLRNKTNGGTESHYWNGSYGAQRSASEESPPQA